MSKGALLDYLRKPQTKQELKVKGQIDIAAQCADGMQYLESTVSRYNIHYTDLVIQCA